MLFATKIARPDNATSISYQTTRVTELDQSDWLKMVHLFKYTRGTKDQPLVLSADRSRILTWYIDGSHVVHPNMWGHVGEGLTMVRGFPILVSSKQKLNTRSSTKSGFFGVDQLMPLVLWDSIFRISGLWSHLEYHIPIQ